jgi:hypothetical protein
MMGISTIKTSSACGESRTKNNFQLSILNSKLIILSFFVFASTTLFSQGLVQNALTSNPVVVKKWNELQMRSQLRSASLYDTVSLDTVKGILDDFSYNGPFPDTALWLDNQVFVNRGFPKSPVTLGVATFDGLAANGYPYDFTVSPTSSSSADSLTSKPINLLNYLHHGNVVNYQTSDSIYFSFYYQPQGLGNSPDRDDSLVLEFKGAGSPWQHIWAKEGHVLAANDSSWKLVMVPLTDLQYFTKGFQFRFRNYATVSGSLDHWNIDYVYLNKNRTKADTIFEDIAFEDNTPSLINNYSAMPWKHYSPTFMKTAYSNTIRNNNSVQKNMNFEYRIFDETGTQVNTTYPGGGGNVDPYVISGCLNDPVRTAPALNFTIPTLTDTTNYTIECILSTNPDKHKQNDTVRHKQEFLNYYAYDDGTAETAFGLSTLNAQLAEKFVSTIGDTLHCIDIYFNPLLINANEYGFTLNVWNDAGGAPGTAVYSSDTVMRPQFDKMGVNSFIHYYLNPPLYVSPSTFYIGFTQRTDQFLNVGVDRNNDSQDKIFYNVSGSWHSPAFPGAYSLMMHPVFGVADFYLGVDNLKSKGNNSFALYPNPANDRLYIKFNATNLSEKISYSIIDLYGRVVLENKSNIPEYIDISSLADGVYFVRILDGTQVLTNKFIKAN